MKQFIACLLVLLLFSSSAGAETISSRIGAPEAFQATYYSNTRRSEVSVDAAVVVPDVVAVHRYEVVPRFLPPMRLN